jgi:hypothetical protein
LSVKPALTVAQVISCHLLIHLKSFIRLLPDAFIHISLAINRLSDPLLPQPISITDILETALPGLAIQTDQFLIHLMDNLIISKLNISFPRFPTFIHPLPT